MKGLLAAAAAAVLAVTLVPAPAEATAVCTFPVGPWTISAKSAQTVDIPVSSLTCPTGIGLRVTITSYRYWVSSKVWTVERGRTLTFTTTVPAFVEAFHCNVPGALMADHVLYERLGAKGYVLSQWLRRSTNSVLCPLVRERR